MILVKDSRPSTNKRHTGINVGLPAGRLALAAMFCLIDYTIPIDPC